MANTSAKAKPPVQGVRGWLAFFIFIQIILGPVVTLLSVLDQLNRTQLTYPQLVGDPIWHAFTSARWSVTAAACAISIATGMLLLLRFKQSSVTIVKWVLVSAPPIIALLNSLVLPTIILKVLFSGERLGQAMGGAVGVELVSLVWVLYLSKSRRVRNTYPESILLVNQ